MKKLLFILFFSFATCWAIGQADTNKTNSKVDSQVSVRAPLPKPVKKRIVPDTASRAATIITADTLKKSDTTNTDTLDSVAPPNIIDEPVKPVAIKKPIDSFYLKLLDNPFLRSKAKPVYLVINERKAVSKDEIFYLIAGLLLFLAFIKLVFGRFFTNIFRLFFQPSFRQKQTREQLQQNNLPSLLLNLFFFISAGAYISFLLQYYHFTTYGFWRIFLYSIATLMIIYIGKFIFLTFAGWVFNVKEAIDAYIFAVYLINKILGVILIPFTLVIAFSHPEITNVL